VETNEDLRSNETIRIIMGRRSVRKFEGRPVEPERIRILLECGFAAPSAKNLRPCHLVQIDDPKMLKDIGGVSEQTRMVAASPLAIAVCVDVARYEREYKSTDGTWMEDCSCAMMNLLLSARALGLEGVWLQILNRPERNEGVERVIGVPDGVRVFAIAVLGYSEVAKPPYSGADETRLHTNGW
jgi:nitroreductase